MQTHRLDMRADPAFLAAIDEWRRHESDIPTRTEAVRRLVLRGLEASGASAPVPASRAPVDIVPKVAIRETAKASNAISKAILAEVVGRPWREQRGALRKAIVAHPGWAAIKERDGLNVASLSSKGDFRPVCAELRLRLPSLDE